VSLEFLSPAPGALARSPMERQAVAAGARIERRDGWHVAAAFDGADAERERCRLGVGFADLSHLGKLEVQADAAGLAAIVAGCAGGERLALGEATRAGGAWWCPYTARRAIVLCDPGATASLRERLEDAAADQAATVAVVDVTCVYAALTLVGPLARELFARFTAIDLRPQATPVCGFRPGSVGRSPGAVLCEADQRYLMLFGAALGQYMWTVVADAAARLGGGPVGVDALDPIDEPLVDVTRHA
jgi:glycine cleavage system aminomethyltransferase T